MLQQRRLASRSNLFLARSGRGLGGLHNVGPGLQQHWRSGAAAVAEALKSNTAVTRLELYNNNIGDRGATAIADALKNNNALQSLDLSDNSSGDSGAVAIVDALKGNRNTALAWLPLYNNDMMCSDHGTQRNDYTNIAAGDRICKCSGLWSGTVCDTDTPGKTALAVVAALAAFVVCVAQFILLCLARKPAARALIRARKQTERAFGRAHPITAGASVQEGGPAGEIAMTTVRGTQMKGFGKNTFVGGTHATRDDDDDELLGSSDGIKGFGKNTFVGGTHATGDDDDDEMLGSSGDDDELRGGSHDEDDALVGTEA